MEDVLVPVSMFAGFTVVLSLYFWFRYRNRQEVQQTIRLALDKGTELSPELIDRLGHPTPGKNRDLRYALIWLGLAAALVLCGVAVPDPTGNALRGCLAGAAFPFSIGVAYLLIWRFAGRD
jgi:hypothetical protein